MRKKSILYRKGEWIFKRGLPFQLLLLFQPLPKRNGGGSPKQKAQEEDQRRSQQRQSRLERRIWSRWCCSRFCSLTELFIIRAALRARYFREGRGPR
jgi:hypothetical protein